MSFPLHLCHMVTKIISLTTINVNLLVRHNPHTTLVKILLMCHSLQLIYTDGSIEKNWQTCVSKRIGFNYCFTCVLHIFLSFQIQRCVSHTCNKSDNSTTLLLPNILQYLQTEPFSVSRLWWFYGRASRRHGDLPVALWSRNKRQLLNIYLSNDSFYVWNFIL